MKQVIKKSISESNHISGEKDIYTVLLDMNSIMKMSLVDKRKNDKEEEYGMIYQTLLQIRNMLQKKDFNYVYAMYDGYNSGVLRYEIYNDYKKNRGKNYENKITDYDKSMNDFVKLVIGKEYKNNEIEKDEESFERQRSVIYDCLENLFVRQIICEDVEGDDLIAYYVNNKKENEKVVIFSGDRDLTQLISPTVCVYANQLKKFITVDNHIKEIGYTHENVLIKKIICGDSSDNIKGIKGVGEKTFFQLFPEAIRKKITLEEIINKSRFLNEERIKSKKKPLASLTNIINSNTDGIQGKDIYKINKDIIDLNEPKLTMEAKEEIDEMMYAPMDPEGRDFGEISKICINNGINELMDSDKFSVFFSPFLKLIDNEKKFFKTI